MKLRVFALAPFALGTEDAGTLRRFAGGKTYLIDVDDGRALSQRTPPPVDFASVVLEDDDTSADADALLVELRATRVNPAQEG